MLTIETELVRHFMPPVDTPILTEYGYTFLNIPSWCSKSTVPPVLVFEAGGMNTWHCNDPISIIGRNEKASIVIENLHVSRCHAAIMHSKNGFVYLVDLGSTHGTFIGKRQLIPFSPTLLPEGSLIKLGLVETLFSIKFMHIADDNADDVYRNTLINAWGPSTQYEVVLLAAYGNNNNSNNNNNDNKIPRANTLEGDELSSYFKEEDDSGSAISESSSSFSDHVDDLLSNDISSSPSNNSSNNDDHGIMNKRRHSSCSIEHIDSNKRVRFDAQVLNH